MKASMQELMRRQKKKEEKRGINYANTCTERPSGKRDTGA